jgi:hypothetical protein
MRWPRLPFRPESPTKTAVGGRRPKELSREAGPEKTARKFSISTCPVMEFDTYEEALAFKTKYGGGDIIEYDEDRADVWHDYYGFDPFR